MPFRIVLVFGWIVLMSLAGITGQLQAGGKPKHAHHHLHHALWELHDARKELAESRHDFGPHKDKALLAITGAIRQVERLLRHTGDNNRGIPTRVDLREDYKRYSHHPHLHQVLVDLKQAQAHLKQDKHTYGGHKEEALLDIQYAIQQVELLIQHPHHHLHHVLWELRDARKELLDSKELAGPHKDKALLAIADAARQVELILRHAGDNTKGIPSRFDLRDEYKRYSHHPHLHHAVNELKQAQAHLIQVKHSYGGHKDAALRDIQLAVVHIELLLHPHRNLHHALWDLRDAREELLLGTAGLASPFKDKALLGINNAAKQVEGILKSLGDTPREIPARGDMRETYQRYPYSPHVHHAQHELRQAYTLVAESRSAQGVQRDAALRDIQFAMQMVDVILKYKKK